MMSVLAMFVILPLMPELLVRYVMMSAHACQHMY